MFGKKMHNGQPAAGGHTRPRLRRINTEMRTDFMITKTDGNERASGLRRTLQLATAAGTRRMCLAFAQGVAGALRRPCPRSARGTKGRALAPAAAAVLLCFGCASPNVNPPAPRSNSGYVDFYTESAGEVVWNIQRLDATANQFKAVFSELDPMAGGILRLAFAPGRQQLRVTFLNHAITEPAVVEVDVRNGQITPVHVALTEAGVASVQTREERLGGTAKGPYGRGTKIGSYETKTFRVTAAVQDPRPYQLKEQMRYAQGSTK